MGRTSKFTFPVPSRRHKPVPPPPPPPGHLSKAQKILGSSEINTGCSSARPWDASSMSGISVSVSDTTCSYSDATLGLLDGSEDEGADQVPELRPKPSRERKEWEQESDIIPPMIRQPSGDSLAKEFDSTSDASSVRRKRMSSASMLSYYDKSKMPLSISQQTSSSAMAKGLPYKANVLLDVDNVAQLSKKKRKPARLDLSHLFLSRSKSSATPSARGMVLGPDLMMKSPSVMSMNSEAALPTARQRVDRKLQKKSIMESLTSAESNPNGLDRARGANDVARLHNLYDHYERMTFRDVMGEGGEEVDWSASEASLTRADKKASTTPAIYGPREEKLLDSARDLSTSQVSLSKPATFLPSPTAADCSASISSRHTRTSKASKRTNHSLQDSDLLEKSVLSLSDDSDDDGLATEPTPLRASFATPNERGNTSGAVTGARSSTPAEHRSRRQSSGQASTRSFRPANHQFLTPPPTTPPAMSLPEPPKTKRASVMPQVPSRTASLRSHSQASVVTTSSLGSRSCGTGTKTSTRKSLSPVGGTRTCGTSPKQHLHAKTVPGNAKEHRGSAALPLANCRSSILPHHLPQIAGSPPSQIQPVIETRQVHPPRQRSTSDQPTPPLSPASVDFPGSADSGGHQRYIAVTRQEERLLAALRSKRKHMREALVAEFEDESSNGLHGHACSQSSTSSAVPADAPGSPASCRRRRRGSIGMMSSGSSTTTIEPPTPLHRRRRSSLSGPPSHITIAPSVSHSDPTPTRPAIPGDNPIYKPEYYFPTLPSTRLPQIITSNPNLSPHTPYKGYNIPAPQHLSFISSGQESIPAERHERVLLYLDRPVNECGPEDQFAAEPSPDLSDFAEYEDLSPATPVAAKRTSLFSSEPSPKAALERNDGDCIVEEDPPEENIDDGEEEIPRPDSPISPDEPGSLGPPPFHHQGRAGLRISAVGPARTSWWNGGKEV